MNRRLILMALALIILPFILHSEGFAQTPVNLNLSVGTGRDVIHSNGALRIHLGFSEGIATRIDGGQSHTLALRTDGTVWAWGDNASGQLGDGTTNQRNTPVQVKGPGGVGFLTYIMAVSGGNNNSLALRTDGTVWAWGDNASGQLGDGTTTSRTTPVQVKGPGGSGFLTGVVAVSAGGTHTLALRTDGTVWAWGGNTYGQLGDGTTTSRTTPVQVKGPGGVGFLTNVAAIAAGNDFSLALLSDGTVWGWGRNDYGHLGDGTTTSRTTPVQVKGPGGSGFLTDVVMVSAGGTHSLALRSDGTIWAWGDNHAGQLGDGTTTSRTTPVQVKGPGGVGFLTDVVAVRSNFYFSLALKSDGTVWAWGRNDYGYLGDGTTTNKTTPVQVKLGGGFLNNVATVSGGYYHSLAIRSDGTVWAWGANWYGQLGDGTTTQKLSPIQSQFTLTPMGYYAAGPYNLNGGWIKNFLVSESGSRIRYLLSKDGVDWRRWNGTAWVSESLRADATGMTKAELEALGYQTINSFLSGSNSFYIGVAMQKETGDPVVSGLSYVPIVVNADLTCPGSLYVLQTGACSVQASTNTGMLAYEWSVSPDGTINGSGSSVGVVFNTLGNKTVNLRVYLAEVPTIEVNRSGVILVENPLTVGELNCHSRLPVLAVGNCSIQASTGAGTLAYEWSVSPDGSVNGSGSSAEVVFNTLGNKTVNLRVYLAEVPSIEANRSGVILVENPLTVGALNCPSGLLALAVGNCSVQALAGTWALAYEWSVSPDGTVNGSGSSAEVSFNSPGSKSVSVTVKLEEFPSISITRTASVLVSLPPITAGTLTCPSSLFKGEAGRCSIEASVPGGTLQYEWSVSGGGGTLTPSGNTADVVFDSTGRKTVGVRISLVEIPGMEVIRTAQVEVINPLRPGVVVDGPRVVLKGSEASYSLRVECPPNATCLGEIVFAGQTYPSSGVVLAFEEIGTFEMIGAAWIENLPELRSEHRIRISVSDVKRPFISISAPKNGEVGVPLTLRANVSSPHGNVIGYWTLPDESVVEGLELVYTPTGPGDLRFKFTGMVEGYPYTAHTVESPVIKVEAYELPQFKIKSYVKNNEGYAPHVVAFGVTGDMTKVIRYQVNLTHTWDMGDGTVKTGGAPRFISHTYKQPGVYTVTLTVSDDRNNSVSDSLVITIRDVPSISVESFRVYPSNKFNRVPLGLLVRPVIKGSSSRDRIVSYEWTVDGVPARGTQSLSYTFVEPGDYMIGLTVTTQSGRTASGFYQVTVNPNRVPECEISYVDNPVRKTTIFASNCKDPDGRVVEYLWDFGNGATSNRARANVRYEVGGTYPVTLSVKDNSGETAVYTKEVTIQR